MKNEVKKPHNIFSNLKQICSVLLFTVLFLPVAGGCLSGGGSESGNSVNKDSRSNAENKQSDTEEVRLVVQIGHDIDLVRISPDGKLAATGSYEGSIKLWDVETGWLVRTLSGHHKAVIDMQFSPDSKYLLSGSEVGLIIQWDIHLGEPRFQADDLGDEVYCISYSPKGTYFAAATWDTINIYLSEKGELVNSIHSGGDIENIDAVALNFSADENTLLSLNYDSFILLDTKTGGLKKLLEPESGSDMSSAFISPDGKSIIYTKLQGSSVWVCDIRSGEVVWRDFREMKANVENIGLYPDGKSMFMADRRNTVEKVRISDGTLLDTFTGPKFSNSGIAVNLKRGLALSLDGKNFNLLAWDISNGTELRRIEGYRKADIPGDEIYSSVDGSYLSYNNGRLLVHDFLSSRVSGAIDLSADGIGRTLQFSPEGDTFFGLITGTGTSSPAVFNSITGEMIQKMGGSHSKSVSAGAFRPDLGIAVSGAWDGEVKIWNTETGALIKTMQPQFKGAPVTTINIADSILLLGGYDTLEFYDLNSFSLIKRAEINTPGVGDQSNPRLISDDGSRVAGLKNGIQVFNPYTGDIIAYFNPERHISAMSISPDGRYVVASGKDGMLLLYDIDSAILANSMKGHVDRLSSIEFIRNGKFIITSSWDNTRRIWRIPDGQLIYSLMFSEDGEQLTWTPDGYFAGSESMAREAVCATDGQSIYAIDQLFDVFYRPDIIAARAMGSAPPALADSDLLKKVLVPAPKVSLSFLLNNGSYTERFRSISDLKISDDTVTVKITPEDQGGGIGELRLFHNGRRVYDEVRGLKSSKPESMKNIFSVRLLNGDNTIEASGLTPAGIEGGKAKAVLAYASESLVAPDLYILSVGINEYKNGKYNLNYAVNDSEGFAAAATEAGKGLYENVYTTVLHNNEALKGNLIQTMEDLSGEIGAEDVFIFFYAGHGIALDGEEQGNTAFYFICPDITQMTDPQQVVSLGLSGEEFNSLSSAIKAKKQVIILDACNSGALNSAFAVRGAGEEIALSRLSKASGSALIAASRADQFAQEFSTLGQGALTRALLDGYAGEAAMKGGQITVASMKSYVEYALPELTEEYSGRAQYPTGFIFGQDFPLGIYAE